MILGGYCCVLHEKHCSCLPRSHAIRRVSPSGGVDLTLPFVCEIQSAATTIEAASCLKGLTGEPSGNPGYGWSTTLCRQHLAPLITAHTVGSCRGGGVSSIIEMTIRPDSTACDIEFRQQRGKRRQHGLGLLPEAAQGKRAFSKPTELPGL